MMPPTPLALVDLLLRDRAALITQVEEDRHPALVARTMLITIAISAAVFGGALGLYRGGWQVVLAALKLPLVILFTAALCAPALTAVRSALVGPARFTRDLNLILTALAVGSVILAATTPVVLVSTLFGVDYHLLILAVVACCAFAGSFGVMHLVRGIVRTQAQARFTACVALALMFVAVGGQMSWTLRPYLVRPSDTAVTIVRDVESSLLEAVLTSANSARGVYPEDAP